MELLQDELGRLILQTPSVEELRIGDDVRDSSEHKLSDWFDVESFLVNVERMQCA